MATAYYFSLIHFVSLFVAQSYVPISVVDAATLRNITSDQHALLALKARISQYDPHNVLTNNWSTSTSVCNWVGVRCGSRHHRITALNLSYMALEGTIPPQMGNLSFLVRLNIRNNSFRSSVPKELAYLRRLKSLDFGFNDFSGEFPSWLGLLSKLQYLALHGNTFTGTIPPSLSNISSLQRLSCSLNQLSGSIPSSIFNISTLQEIYLGGNKLSGPMPSIFFDLPSLQILDLAANYELSGALPMDMFDHLPNLNSLSIIRNQFSGELPSTLFRCTQLKVLSLSFNNFSGRVPQEIRNLTMLVYLDLDNNKFEGRVPPELGNLTMLAQLYLGFNDFKGALPREIGNLQNLEVFTITNSSIAGSIPFGIFNISTIQYIAMEFNNLSGHLPPNFGLFLPNLREISLANNELTGTIPSSISNASQLTHLDLSSNSFSGLIPKTLGNLRFLQLLHLGNNNMTLESPDLFSSLSNCIYLTELNLFKNPLDIILPNSVGNLSRSLQNLYLSNCSIKGGIPIETGNLSSLFVLSLAYNKLEEPIPNTVGRLRMLQGLYLEGNRLKGPIPSDLCHLTNLVDIGFGGNELSGHIPACINNLTSLRNLYLGSNQLTYIVPLSLWSLTYLLEVDLQSNSLSGSLSLEIGNMKTLKLLYLSRNQFSGFIPETIGGLQDLANLSLAANQLEGSIPESFGKMVSLEFLDLSDNKLSGEIPKSLEALRYLKYLNLSFNKLRGEIPKGGLFVNLPATAFMSNDALCGDTRLQVPPCKNKATGAHILKYVLPPIGLMILILFLALLSTRHKKRNVRLSGGLDLEISPLATMRRISHQEILRATEGFNVNNLLGEGSFGSVYKGTLLDGTNVAIKVLKLQVEGAFKSFDVECEVLRNIRHRNLIKIISACSNMDFKALVMEYMPNANLDVWLYHEGRHLNMLQRLNIMIDVATALEYLHLGYSTPIVHCDLKPSNILLDEDMVGHVADFGIAKLLSDGISLTQTMTLATIGYMAPEYGSEGIVSARGDIYSYGILLMETFTKKKPTDDIFTGEVSLKRLVEESLFLSIMEVVDINLLGDKIDYSVMENCLSSIMGLALNCCADLPEQRIDVKNVSSTLQKIKRKFLQDIGIRG
ncbi:hypothetical protein CIPAW_09G134400 [Carya illinoinensis]|uniref:non-specific serine/threonine protein kinase n=2 Tax=Carya illinoinensis TaxID=32201 RepID=A0A8T1PLD1_CARIL|nr:hypothetical protein CIPAW_09G134400 [Carya illinoinensis]